MEPIQHSTNKILFLLFIPNSPVFRCPELNLKMQKCRMNFMMLLLLSHRHRMMKVMRTRALSIRSTWILLLVWNRKSTISVKHYNLFLFQIFQDQKVKLKNISWAMTALPLKRTAGHFLFMFVVICKGQGI